MSLTGRLGQDLASFSLLVETIYDAATDSRQWESFLARLASALNAKSGLFRIVDERARALHAGVYHNLDGPLQEAYRQYYVAQDPIVDALTRAPDVFIAPGEAFLDTSSYRHSEFFNDYARPQDNYHICGGLAMRNDQFTIKFGVQRDRKTGPFSWSDADFIHQLVPHIQRATRLGHLFEIAGAQTASADQALASMAVGFILLDDSLRIIHLNDEAERALRDEAGLTLAHGRIAAVSPADARRLDDILTTAVERTRQNAPPVPEALLLRPAAEQPERVLVALPVRENHTVFHGPWRRPSVALFLCGLHDRAALNRQLLEKVFRLTPREAHLAAELSKGRTIAEIASAWHVSRETLRTHLKRVLAKTGAAGQADLARLLTGAPWTLAEH